MLMGDMNAKIEVEKTDTIVGKWGVPGKMKVMAVLQEDYS